MTNETKVSSGVIIYDFHFIFIIPLCPKNYTNITSGFCIFYTKNPNSSFFSNHLIKNPQDLIFAPKIGKLTTPAIIPTVKEERKTKTAETPKIKISHFYHLLNSL